MNKSFTFIGTALCAGMGLVASNAMAVDFEWDGGAMGNNDWSDPLNWTADSGVPDDAGDTATLDPASSVTVSMDGNYTIGELIVGEKVTLNIGSNNTLTLDGTGAENGKLTIQATSESVFGVINIRDKGTFTFVDPDADIEHEIGGNFVLQQDESVMQITDDDATFGPYDDGSSLWYGNVVGEHDDAQLLIESTFTLFVDIVVQGQMKIGDFGGAGDPEFELLEDGHVLANVPGTLCFEVDVQLDDFDTANNSLWEVASSSGAVLLFNESPPATLNGKFILDACAMMKAAEGVSLSTNGSIVDDAGGSHDGYIDACGTSGGSSTTLLGVTDDIGEGISSPCSNQTCS